MKILFVNLSGLRFTVATPDNEPLGGTESALCYVARQLAANRHDVTLIAHRPDNAASTVMGVRHEAPELLLNGDFIAAQNFDVIVVNNRAVGGSPLRAMAPKTLLLLWNHVVPDHPAMQELAMPAARGAFDGIIYVSQWQRQVTENFFGFQKPSVVIGNGFAPAFENMFASAAELRAAKENRAAYTTTPFRGLHILLDVMKGLTTGTRLDLYSSMKVYQAAAGDDQYAPLYRYAVENPLITRHDAVSQSMLAERLLPVAFFTYPSTYAETFCIAALESVAAGLKVITTATAALPEVLGPRADYAALSAENPAQLVSDFRQLIDTNVKAFQTNPGAWAEERFAALQDVNRTSTWAVRARQWEKLLTERSFD
jgi:glycosyltransferase involved in cell wall biosynthesis